MCKLLAFFVVISLVVIFSAAAFPQASWAPPSNLQTLELWPHGAPGVAPNAPPESVLPVDPKNLKAGKPFVSLTQVSNPTLTVFPPKDKNTGAAMVVFPGGGYRFLAIDLEGTEVCDWLTSIGVSCFLVKYRVPGTGPYPKSAAALQDAQRALGIVRSRAAEWHIDANRIGVIGFSAGAHLAAALSTHFDKRIYDAVDEADHASCRPDFAAIIYPGYLALADKGFALNPDIPVSSETPSSFILQAEDDGVHVENSIVYFLALKSAKVPAEMHIYAAGGHGYGLRPTDFPVTHWPTLVEAWLRTIHVAGE
jgi:acetyl esterase/lipase